MSKSPSFQWYPKDILGSARVQEMSLAEEGAYRRLLDYCWLNGSIPADDKRCARLIGKGATPEIANAVLVMFTPHPTEPGRMIHDRLEEEREKQRHNSEARRTAAEARWNKRGTSGETTGKRAKSTADANALQTESFAIATANSDSKESGATAPNIFDVGLPLLTHGGAMTNKNARGLLAKLAQQHGNEKVASAIAVTSMQPRANPHEYLIGVLNKNGPPARSQAELNRATGGLVQ